jgi:hypothetical protein
MPTKYGNFLESNIFPTLGHRPVADIFTHEVLDVIRAGERHGAIDAAGRILQRCSTIFRFAVQTHRATNNPATDLKGVLQTRKIVHRQALNRQTLRLSALPIQ